MEKVIVEGPADVLVGADADWSKILVHMSNDDFFHSHKFIGELLLGIL
jgi:hypothetical protein